YDIPSMTGVTLASAELLRRSGKHLPSLAGIKFTNHDLMQFQECIQFEGGRYEIWFGCDEALLAGYSLGAKGAVGSTYNFAAPLYHQLIAAWDAGDQDRARALQAQSVQLIRCCQKFGYMAAAKAVMGMLGVDCGPVRPPLANLSSSQRDELRQTISSLNLLPLVPG
ncbi:MAG: dihydrodipicolinate synthase family protein, partial [Planctomycetaceae bacterium]